MIPRFIPGWRRRSGTAKAERPNWTAMWPGSSVSGLYIAHPDAYYFGVAKVERDQVEDYARRKGMDIADVERWLSPILNYDPASYRLEAAE